MERFFIELFYKGTDYAGFQAQKNANTIQAEVEKALQIYFRKIFLLTGSSRTDAGVHALQNYFHFDASNMPEGEMLEQSVYHINAILPSTIVLKRIYRVSNELHCRFNAISRTYQYNIYLIKNPFLSETAYFYPHILELDLLQQAATLICDYSDFESFSKRNTQVHNFECTINKSEWVFEKHILKFTVNGNRFLRGMVRGLVGTMIKVGRKKISVHDFKEILENKKKIQADFSVPAKGLCLIEVNF